MQDEYEPWKRHDGGLGPRRIGPLVLRFVGAGIKIDSGADLPEGWPGWRWKMVWVGRGLRPVCDDPAYAPIVAYRFLKPPRASVSSADDLLAEITNPAHQAGSPAGALPALRSAHACTGPLPLVLELPAARAVAGPFSGER